MVLNINKIYLMDCLQGMKLLRPNSVNLIITDPPYNIASPYCFTKSGGRIVTTQQAWGKWDTYHPFEYDLLIMNIINECYRVLKSGGAMYMFTANADNGYFIRLAKQRGFISRNQLAIIKKNPQFSYTKKNWRSAFELCLYVTKGQVKTFNFISQDMCNNIFPYAIGFKDTTHPTEKPLGFIKRLVMVSSNQDDIVLDPFMGSGTTAVACKQLGRNFIGFEVDDKYVEIANQRLERTNHHEKVYPATHTGRM